MAIQTVYGVYSGIVCWVQISAEVAAFTFSQMVLESIEFIASSFIYVFASRLGWFLSILLPNSIQERKLNPKLFGLGSKNPSQMIRLDTDAVVATPTTGMLSADITLRYLQIKKKKRKKNLK